MKKLCLALFAMVLSCIGVVAQDAAENIFITGDATEYGWHTSNPEASRLVQQPDGLYKWSGTLKKTGRFRFITTNKWYPTYTTTASSHLSVKEGTYDIQYDASGRSGEPSFRALASGEYTITLDLTQMVMNITLDKADENEPVQIWITGSATPCGWATTNAIEMTRIDDKHFTWTGDLTKENDGRFRFLTSAMWWPSYTTAQPQHELVKAGVYAITYYETGPSGEPSFMIEIPGNYTVDLDLEQMSMTLTLNSAIEQKYVYLMGNSLTGNDLADGEALPTAEFHLTADNIYEWKGDLFDTTASGNRTSFVLTPDPEGNITYTPRLDLAGDEEVNPDATYDLFERDATTDANDNRFFPAMQGNYSIMVDTRLMTMTVSRNKSELYLVGGAVTGANAPWGFNDKYLSKMTETATPLVFEWTGMLHANSADGKVAKFKFLTSSSAWAGYVNGSGEDTTVEYDGIYPLLDSSKPGSGDFQFTVPSDGIYHLLVNLRDLTLTVTDGTSGIFTAVAATGVDMSVTGRTINIAAAEPAQVAVYDIAGRTIASTVITEGSLSLPDAGIYIVKINDLITKIAVK